MAENVFIQGVGNNSNLKQWASEDTLSKVLDALHDANKINEDTLKAFKSRATGSSGGNNARELDNELEDLIREVENTGDSLGNLGTEADETADDIDRLGKKTQSFGDALLNVTKAGIGGLITGLGMLTGTVHKQMNMVTELNEAGLNMGRNAGNTAGGFASFASAATEANLSMQELSAITKKSTTVMNQFGVVQFGKMSRSLTDGLSNLGVTSTEGAELLAEYLEQQQTLGVADRLSHTAQMKNAKEQIQSADKWGKQLGISRKEMMENSKSLKENVNVNAFLNRSSVNVQKAFEQMNNGLAGFDKGTSQSIMQSLANPIIQTSELFDQLSKSGMSEAANELVRMQQIVTDPNVDPYAAEQAMDDFLKVIADQDTELAQIIGDSDTALALVQEAKKRGLLSEAHEKELEAQQAQAKANVKVQETWKKVTESFNRFAASIFGNEKLMTAIQDAIMKVTEKFNEIYPTLLDFGKFMITGFMPIFEFAGNAIMGLINVVNKVSDVFGDKGPLVVAIGALAAFITLSIAKAKAGQMIGGLKDRIIGGAGRSPVGPSGGSGGSSKGGGLLGGLGKGIGEFGKGIGKGIAGIFKGLALGLRAFANPAILVGAAIFAGAMTVISAGLSASAYIISLSMPMLAESLKSFEEVDPTKLDGVGGALLSLSGGLAAFGAASVASSAGGLLSGIADGIGSLFGAESPIDTLMKFSDVGPGMAEAGKGVQALSLGLSGIGKAVAELPDMDELEDIVDIMNDADPAKITALASALQKNRTNVATSTPSKVRGSRISQIDPVLDAQKSKGTTPTTVAETGMPSNKDLNATENAINTILARQTELLEMILVNSSSQLDNMKKLRKSSEESF